MQAPLSRVWRCELRVEEYAALGKAVEVPVQACPECERRLAFAGWYERGVRLLEESARELRIWIRRGYCCVCDRSHALLPDFLHEWRKDAVETIGRVLTRVVEEGRERVFTAVEMRLPLNTVRNLCQRHRARADLLYAGFTRLAVERGGQLARLPGNSERGALAAAREGWEEAVRRWGAAAVGSRWNWWSRVTGGRPLGRQAPTFPGSASASRGSEDGRQTTEEEAHGPRPPGTDRPAPLPGHR